MTLGRSHGFHPFASRSRRPMIAILVTLALVSGLSALLSVRATQRAQHGATVLEVAARQRTLTERYVQEVLLVRESQPANPAYVGSLLAASARALLAGGIAPAATGDDDDSRLSRMTDPVVRRQFEQEQRLVHDLNATGNAVLNGQNVMAVPLTAHEKIASHDPLQRLRILAALTSNVSLSAAHSLAQRSERNISRLIEMQLLLALGGLVVSLLLAWALIAATRRQTQHFKSLVSSSTDLVFVLAGGCRYVSESVTSTLGRPTSDLLGDGWLLFLHEDDRGTVENAQATGEPRRLVMRLQNATGEWRHLDAHLTDLRHDRHVRGMVLNARDITDRVRLEQELVGQAQRDTFGNHLIEALEMADEEHATYEVIERAMLEVAPKAPMELLLSDSSRAHLAPSATSAAGAPGCPVQSPFSCVAVRRGNPVVFGSSEALNACPKLRGRPGGPCSAVCVPVSFMGRALGVLHATGPHGEPPDALQVTQLTTLAAQAGARIGTVRAFEKTQLQASTDGLTGLINRRTLEASLREMLKHGRHFALAFADLDRFKQLNDTHGHEAGDRALRVFAQTAQEVLREGDTVARWGGEEFVIVLPDIDRHQAVEVLERLRTCLVAAHTGGHPPFTASFGLTDSTCSTSLEHLVHLADTCLYASKEGGRDQITISDSPPSSPSERRKRPRPRPAPTVAGRPALHDAADEEDPRADGVEIR
jgi:diguanylate cyclase (GGDEF)-like protein/PAS domain S-box-containing protein